MTEIRRKKIVQFHFSFYFFRSFLFTVESTIFSQKPIVQQRQRCCNIWKHSNELADTRVQNISASCLWCPHSHAQVHSTRTLRLPTHHFIQFVVGCAFTVRRFYLFNHFFRVHSESVFGFFYFSRVSSSIQK